VVPWHLLGPFAIPRPSSAAEAGIVSVRDPWWMTRYSLREKATWTWYSRREAELPREMLKIMSRTS